MELELKIDGIVALTLRPMHGDWPHGDSMMLHPGCAKLSCGFSPETPREQIDAWLRHLVPENGHYTEFLSTASKRMNRLGYGDHVANVGQALWGNAEREYTGKVVLEARDGKGNRVQSGNGDEYSRIGDDDIGMLVAAAGRIAEQGRMPPQVKVLLRDHGLSGNRGKVCLRWSWRERAWMVPRGNALSSHILKEESSREWLPAEAAIESYCQRALALAGIDTATTRARLYNSIATVVSERTDRVDHRDARPLGRTHQEEWSQAIRIHPYQKSEDDRPETDWRSLFRLLGTYGHRAQQQQHALARAIAGLTFIGCADTHRRNVGIQHVWGREGEKIVLAPLYDCSSIEGTEWAHYKRAVISIGGEAEFDQVKGVHWRRLAEAGGVETALVLDAVREAAEKLPDALRDAARNANEHDHASTAKARDGRIRAIEKHTVQRCTQTLHELGTRDAARNTRTPVCPRPQPRRPEKPGGGIAC